MRTSRTHQPLTYDVRLPDEAQADALRLLDASRTVVNQALTLLWPHLDEFGSEPAGPAWKQVGKSIASPSPTVIVSGDARAKWWGDSYANKPNGKRRLNWWCPFLRTASSARKRKSARRAKIGPRSKKPLPRCKKAWMRMKPALLRSKMWSSSVAITTSSRIVSLLRTKSCKRSRS